MVKIQYVIIERSRSPPARANNNTSLDTFTVKDRSIYKACEQTMCIQNHGIAHEPNEHERIALSILTSEQVCNEGEV